MTETSTKWFTLILGIEALTLAYQGQVTYVIMIGIIISGLNMMDDL
jgi:hypothetical protein